MILPSRRFPLRVLILLASVCSTLPLRADILELKNGEKLKGEILSKDGDTVLMEYYVTATIKDQKSVPKSEIERIVTVSEDEKAFRELGGMEPFPTVLDATVYDSLIDRKSPQFEKAYPYSSHLGVVREKVAVLVAERDRLRKGDRKIDGTWITAADLSTDPYQNGARVRLAQMKLSAASGDPSASLQSYELLEKEFPGSDAMAQALPLALAQMSQLQSLINEVRGTFDVKEKARLAAIAAAPADQAKEMKAMHDREVAASAAAQKAGQDTGSKFFAVFAGVKESIDALQNLLNSEHDRLVTLSKTPMAECVADCAAAAKLQAGGNSVAAKDKLAAADKLWPQCASIATIRKRIEEGGRPVQK